MARSLAQRLAVIDAELEAPPPTPDRDADEKAAAAVSGRGELAAAARHYLRCRRQREGTFSDDLFADPAWDLLLDLFACANEGKQVTVSDACIAANVPASTALRSLSRIERRGLIARRPDPADGRRTHLELTPQAERQMAQWLRSAFSIHGR